MSQPAQYPLPYAFARSHQLLLEEQDGNLTIVPADGKPVQVLVGKIRSRKPNSGSAMPAMGGPLDRRQVRDLIEFLSRQKKQ